MVSSARRTSRPGPSFIVGSMLASALGLAVFGVLFERLIYEDVADLVVYNTVATARAFAGGHFPYWDPHLALGVPMTHTQDLALHPLSLLFLVLSPALVLAIFVFAHVLLAQYFTLRLCRLLGLTGSATALAIVSLTLSEPALEFTVLNAYPTLLVQWAFIPVLFFYLIGSFQASTSASRLRSLAALALTAAFVVWNSHPGFSSGALLSVAGLGLLEVIRRRSARLMLGLVASALFAAAMSADKVVAMLTEVMLSPADLPRSGHSYSSVIYDGIIWQMAFRPFVLGDLGAIRDAFALAGPGGLVSHLASEYVRRNADWLQWSPFFGPPFALLAMYASARRRSWLPLGWSLPATFAICLVILVLPPRLLGPLGAIMSGTVAFRDPVVFLGIVIAAGALSQLQRIDGGARRLPRHIAAAQVCLLLVAAVPSFFVVITKADYTALTGRATSALADFSLDPATRDALSRATGGPPGRVYTVEAGYAAMQKMLDGGYSSFGGWVKGVTLEVLAPTPFRGYGYIPEDRILLDRALLEVLGVRDVLIGRTVTPPAFLRPAGQLRLGGTDVIVLRNPGAWSPAVFVSDSVRRLDLPKRAGCGFAELPPVMGAASVADARGSFLCRDLSQVVALREPGAVHLDERGGDLTLRFAAAPQARTIMVSQMFRPGWRGTAGGREVEAFPVLGTLIGVTVPGDVSEVRLEYRPTERVAARWIGAAALLVALLMLVARRVRRIPGGVLAPAGPITPRS